MLENREVLENDLKIWNSGGRKNFGNAFAILGVIQSNRTDLVLIF